MFDSSKSSNSSLMELLLSRLISFDDELDVLAAANNFR